MSDGWMQLDYIRYKPGGSDQSSSRILVLYGQPLVFLISKPLVQQDF